MVGRRTILTLGLSFLILFIGLGSAFGSEKYCVKRGDTLCKIARKHGVTPQALRDANGLRNNSLRVKQTLIIPGDKSKTKKKSARAGNELPPDREIYVVKEGDTIQGVADYAGLSVAELKRMNHLRTRKLRDGQRLVIPKQEAFDEMEDALSDGDEAASTPPAEADEDKPASASVLGKWRSPDERKIFVRVAKTFLGVPYRLGGSSMKGIDCSAFVRKVYEIFDIRLPRTAREQARVGKWVSKEELEEGDLVFFKTRSRRVTGHVGIYIGNGEFVHASGKHRGVKVDSLASEHYSKYFVRGVRVMDIDRELAKNKDQKQNL
ncbi:MAG TPA: NlpC/P60 family protein [Syntrophales bacterium]|nr:NlpC/P60 family protein [Syntrophales bacterium]HRT27532.1 NlpC/P60 family protein [Syntrophales bacterium]HRT70632.1 NlpC/P60 family protein [Syntrophales bacterium]